MAIVLRTSFREVLDITSCLRVLEVLASETSMGVTMVNGRVGKWRRIREGPLLRMYDMDYCIPFIIMKDFETYWTHIFYKS
jgi:hypothetical protein